MDEQMIADELQHKLAEAIENVIWPLADWDGDRLNASSAAGKAATAAHSVMAGKVVELTEALDGAVVALDECANIIRPKLPSLADNVIAPVAAKARAALAPYPERRSE